jgi:hypothetical protein
MLGFTFGLDSDENLELGLDRADGSELGLGLDTTFVLEYEGLDSDAKLDLMLDLELDNKNVLGLDTDGFGLSELFLDTRLGLDLDAGPCFVLGLCFGGG